MITEKNFREFRKAVKEAVVEQAKTGDPMAKFEFEGQMFFTSHAIHTIDFLLGWYQMWDDDGNPRPANKHFYKKGGDKSGSKETTDSKPKSGAGSKRKRKVRKDGQGRKASSKGSKPGRKGRK